MTSPDFSEDEGSQNEESFEDLIERWLALPSMIDLAPEHMQRVEDLSHPKEGPVKQFRDEEHDTVSALVKEGKHFDALRLVRDDLARIEEMFQGDDAISAREMAYRMRAYAHEHLGTFGPYSELPSSDPARRMMFRQAAASYALSDMELGGKSDYFLRVSECLLQARMFELGGIVLEQFLGPNFIVIGKKDAGAQVAIQDLSTRASEVERVESSVGSVTRMKGSMPNPSLN